MKKFLIGLVLTVAFFAQVAYGADISSTWGWGQSSITGIASTDVFRGSSATGPWTLVKNQPIYTLVPPATEYQTTAAVNVPDNAQTTVWFKAQNVGTTGLRSVDSNIMSHVYDTRVTPAAPTGFRVVTPQ